MNQGARTIVIASPRGVSFPTQLTGMPSRRTVSGNARQMGAAAAELKLLRDRMTKEAMG